MNYRIWGFLWLSMAFLPVSANADLFDTFVGPMAAHHDDKHRVLSTMVVVGGLAVGAEPVQHAKDFYVERSEHGGELAKSLEANGEPAKEGCDPRVRKFWKEQRNDTQ